MRDDEPNWGLAFACGSFLIVWCLAAWSGVSYEVMLLRGGVAAILGGGLGVLVGYTIGGIRALREGLHEKGASVDFTIADEEPLLPVARPAAGDPDAAPEARERVVPRAAEPVGPSGESFQPLDLKAASKHVQSLVQD